MEEAEKTNEIIDDQISDVVEEEILEEEEGEELPDLPNTIKDIPVPESVEEHVNVQSDGKPFNELSNYEKIRFASAQQGVEIKKPNPSCKHCHGTGIISTRKIFDPSSLNELNTSGLGTSGIDKSKYIEEIPNPCKCIFHKRDMNKMFTGKVPITTKMEKLMEKRDRAKDIKNSTKYKLEQVRLAKAKKDKKKRMKKMKKKFKR